MRLWVAIAGLLLASGPGLAPALAMESAPVVSKRATVTLVSDADSVGPGGAIRLALRIRQAPGWHTYWRNPGDAGVPAELNFTLPDGAAVGPILWPTPERVREGEITTFAYQGEVLLPVAATTRRGAALPVTLAASWLVCEKICVPEEGRFTLDIPAGIGAPSPEVRLFAAAAERTPRPSPWEARLDPAGLLSVSGPDLGPASVREAWFAPYEADRIDVSAAQDARIGPGRVSLALSKPKTDAILAGVLVLRDPGGRVSAFDIAASPGPALTPIAAGAGTPKLLAFAFLAGLILNVMPCVFPVLAMKAAGLVGLAERDRGRVRAQALSYLAGVVATFCAVGLALAALRRAGELVGWGFQFQSPVFVAGAAFVLFLVGLNLSGVFAIGGGRLSGAGSTLAARGGHVGSFATGALAVLVASPCTAPFMGAAVAAALATPGPLTLAVFVCLGLGLALPYVALAWMPGLGRLMPRPGMWMERARQALAFPMYLTVAWLAWVLAQQAGADGVLLLAVGCTVLAFAAWLLGLAQRGGRGRPVLVGMAAIGVVAVFAALATVRTAPAAAADAREAFSVPRLDALRAAGTPVFVDMTAAWCVTCLVNERVALAPAVVRDAFARGGVTLLRGDWTRRDPEITTFLRAHGSDGVPLYVFYPGPGRDPVVLPQILTPGIVLDALRGAA